MEAMKTYTKSAAFFDLDLTLTKKDCYRLFLKALYFSGLSGIIFLPYILCLWVLRKTRMISLKTFKEKSLILLKGTLRSRIRNLGDLFFNKWLQSEIRDKAFQKIKWHQQRGDLILIVSGSPDIYVHAVCDFIGCHDYACTRLEYDQKKFTGRFVGPDCLGSEKKNLIYALADWHGIDLSNSIAYSDHESDLPFLETLGEKVVVSPSPALEKIALERGWQVVQW